VQIHSGVAAFSAAQPIHCCMIYHSLLRGSLSTVFALLRTVAQLADGGRWCCVERIWVHMLRQVRDAARALRLARKLERAGGAYSRVLKYASWHASWRWCARRASSARSFRRISQGMARVCYRSMALPAHLRHLAVTASFTWTLYCSPSDRNPQCPSVVWRAMPFQ
jgi:hypothetical protein